MLQSNTNNMHYKKKSTQSGFTLIELSIVLVIIGLIIGGILVGQDLIKAAELRATVQQIEKFNSAVNTFRGKYGYIPGDIAVYTASAFGLYTMSAANAGTTTAAGGPGMGDGNSKLEGAAAASVRLNGENAAFWRHLSDADLVEGDFGSALTTGADLGGATTMNTIGTYIPPAKMGRNNYITAYSLTGLNYYVIGGIGVVATTGIYGTTAGNTTNNMPPPDAFNIDSKIDDGKPTSGVVVALDISAGTFNTTYLAACGTAASNIYVVTTVSNQCALRLRFN